MLENASNYFYNIGFKKVTTTIVSTIVTYIKDIQTNIHKFKKEKKLQRSLFLTFLYIPKKIKNSLPCLRLWKNYFILIKNN